ncbi:MAG: hypothetical protein J7L56_03155 [Halomonas sp.]|nr:hypothetical protein [Halomonas sp.]MCD6437248.1 hypothetical protein [Halomonas sp.]
MSWWSSFLVPESGEKVFDAKEWNFFVQTIGNKIDQFWSYLENYSRIILNLEFGDYDINSNIAVVYIDQYGNAAPAIAKITVDQTGRFYPAPEARAVGIMKDVGINKVYSVGFIDVDDSALLDLVDSFTTSLYTENEIKNYSGPFYLSALEIGKICLVPYYGIYIGEIYTFNTSPNNHILFFIPVLSQPLQKKEYWLKVLSRPSGLLQGVNNGTKLFPVACPQEQLGFVYDPGNSYFYYYIPETSTLDQDPYLQIHGDLKQDQYIIKSYQNFLGPVQPIIQLNGVEIKDGLLKFQEINNVATLRWDYDMSTPHQIPFSPELLEGFLISDIENDDENSISYFTVQTKRNNQFFDVGNIIRKIYKLSSTGDVWQLDNGAYISNIANGFEILSKEEINSSVVKISLKELDTNTPVYIPNPSEAQHTIAYDPAKHGSYLGTDYKIPEIYIKIAGFIQNEISRFVQQLKGYKAIQFVNPSSNQAQTTGKLLARLNLDIQEEGEGLVQQINYDAATESLKITKTNEYVKDLIADTSTFQILKNGNIYTIKETGTEKGMVLDIEPDEVDLRFEDSTPYIYVPNQIGVGFTGRFVLQNPKVGKIYLKALHFGEKNMNGFVTWDCSYKILHSGVNVYEQEKSVSSTISYASTYAKGNVQLDTLAEFTIDQEIGPLLITFKLQRQNSTYGGGVGILLLYWEYSV